MVTIPLTSANRREKFMESSNRSRQAAGVVQIDEIYLWKSIVSMVFLFIGRKT
jgi:hypothetical protein